MSTVPQLDTSELFVSDVVGQMRDGNRVLVFAASKGLAFHVSPAAWVFLSRIAGSRLSSLGDLSPAQAHFVDRLFDYGLVDDSPPRNAHPTPVFEPERLIVLPTADCNLRCAYCFSGGGNTEATIQAPVAKAAVDLVVGLIEDRGAESFFVSFLGGASRLWRGRFSKRLGNMPEMFAS